MGSQRGAALVEFALVIPLFLSILWGLVTLVAIARARLQIAIVARAVVREAAAGVRDREPLTEVARVYARACGMDPSAVASLTAEARAGGVKLGVAGGKVFGWLVGVASWTQVVAVRARVRIPDSLRLLVGPVEIECANTCVVGTWKEPWAMLGRLIPLPGVSKKKEGGE
jgi:Flp pilus assembly protein TadG